jgi:hypothetical protein
LVFSDGLRF